jgi:hypothetical protein
MQPQWAKLYVKWVKVKVTLEQATKTQKGEWVYSSTLSLTWAVDEVCAERQVLAALPPGKTRYQLYKRLGGHQGQCGEVRKISPPPGLDLRTVQPVASHYTD